MEHRQINENYRAIAEKLIAQEPALAYIKDSRVKITYLESDSTKKDGRITSGGTSRAFTAGKREPDTTGRDGATFQRCSTKQGATGRR